MKVLSQNVPVENQVAQTKPSKGRNSNSGRKVLGDSTNTRANEKRNSSSKKSIKK